MTTMYIRNVIKRFGDECHAIGGFDDDDLTFDRTSVCVRMSSQ